jgi:hypothetical protein
VLPDEDGRLLAAGRDGWECARRADFSGAAGYDDGIGIGDDDVRGD